MKKSRKKHILLKVFVFLFFINMSINIYSASYTNLLIDNFENNNLNLNGLGEYADVEVLNGEKWFGETAWAARTGSGGFASSLSNTNSGFSCYYYTVISNSGAYMDFSDRYNNYAIVWWMRNDTSKRGPFRLDIIEIDAPNYANRAEVEFKYYNSLNPGTNAVTNNTYQEFIIPLSGFTNMQSGFDWTKIKSIVFKTVTSQTSQWRMDDLMIVRGVEISEVSISNTTTSSTEHFANFGDNILIKVLERSNIYGCGGYVVLSNSLSGNKTNLSLAEINVGANSIYYTNFKPLVAGKYFINTVLSNKYAKDSNGVLTNSWDNYFYAGVGVSEVDSFVSTDTDEKYFTGQNITFTVTESNGFNDLTGYIRITNANFSTNITLTNYTGGEYRCKWDTTGLDGTNYYCEARLAGDTNGANNSGIDLTVILTNIPGGTTISSIDSSSGTDNDENYSVNSVIKFTVTEANSISGLTGKIIIQSSSLSYSNEVSLISIGSGIYECEWDTSGLQPSRDYEIESQLGSDLNGYNDSGVDLIISLYEIGNVSFYSNEFYQKYNGEAYINIPAAALKDSESAGIDIETISMDTGSKVLYGNIYKFLPANFRFSQPVKIGLPVPALSGYGLYLYNGFEWLKVNSRINTISGKNYLETDSFTTGIYAVFTDTSFTVDTISVSRKVFSPNNDGINDYIDIIVPASSSDIRSIIIYNLNGKEIRNLNNGLLWDGKDNNNVNVKSGVYVIKVKVGDKSYYKTITVINK